MYESPIHLHYDYADPQKIQELYVKEQERYIVKCCVNMGVTVDRDELVKALQYDRGQYEKGFDDGRAEGYRAGVDFDNTEEVTFHTKNGKDVVFVKRDASDVRSVKEAENITENNPVDEFVCSKCGIILEDWSRVEIDEDDGERTNHEYVFRFCPNCGSKIGGANRGTD